MILTLSAAHAFIDTPTVLPILYPASNYYNTTNALAWQHSRSLSKMTHWLRLHPLLMILVSHLGSSFVRLLLTAVGNKNYSGKAEYNSGFHSWHSPLNCLQSWCGRDFFNRYIYYGLLTGRKRDSYFNSLYVLFFFNSFISPTRV